MGHVGTNVRGLVSTNKCLHAARAIPAASAPSFPYVTSSLELLALVSVLRVGVYRLVAASLFLISSTQHRKKTTIYLYFKVQLGTCDSGTFYN